jgi:putative NIF3 family GTP cyclohydrolase 1 type 2
MHLSEDHLKEAEKNHLKVVVAGHIASDTVGLNLLLDRLAGPETLQIRGCSGFTRLGR